MDLITVLFSVRDTCVALNKPFYYGSVSHSIRQRSAGRESGIETGRGEIEF